MERDYSSAIADALLGNAQSFQTNRQANPLVQMSSNLFAQGMRPNYTGDWRTTLAASLVPSLLGGVAGYYGDRQVASDRAGKAELVKAITSTADPAEAERLLLEADMPDAAMSVRNNAKKVDIQAEESRQKEEAERTKNQIKFTDALLKAKTPEEKAMISQVYQQMGVVDNDTVGLISNALGSTPAKTTPTFDPDDFSTVDFIGEATRQLQAQGLEPRYANMAAKEEASRIRTEGQKLLPMVTDMLDAQEMLNSISEDDLSRASKYFGKTNVAAARRKALLEGNAAFGTNKEDAEALKKFIAVQDKMGGLAKILSGSTGTMMDTDTSFARIVAGFPSTLAADTDTFIRQRDAFNARLEYYENFEKRAMLDYLGVDSSKARGPVLTPSEQVVFSSKMPQETREYVPKIKAAYERLTGKELPKKAVRATPEMMKALFAVESNNDSNAVSPKGATGIGQIMPETWAEIRGELIQEMGIDIGTDRTNKDANRVASEHYFEKMLKTFDGNVELAYAAYNAGPGRVAKVLDAEAKRKQGKQTGASQRNGEDTPKSRGASGSWEQGVNQDDQGMSPWFQRVYDEAGALAEGQVTPLDRVAAGANAAYDVATGGADFHDSYRKYRDKGLADRDSFRESLSTSGTLSRAGIGALLDPVNHLTFGQSGAVTIPRLAGRAVLEGAYAGGSRAGLDMALGKDASITDVAVNTAIGGGVGVGAGLLLGGAGKVVSGLDRLTGASDKATRLGRRLVRDQRGSVSLKPLDVSTEQRNKAINLVSNKLKITDPGDVEQAIARALAGQDRGAPMGLADALVDSHSRKARESTRFMANLSEGADDAEKILVPRIQEQGERIQALATKISEADEPAEEVGKALVNLRARLEDERALATQPLFEAGRASPLIDNKALSAVQLSKSEKRMWKEAIGQVKSDLTAMEGLPNNHISLIQAANSHIWKNVRFKAIRTGENGEKAIAERLFAKVRQVIDEQNATYSEGLKKFTEKSEPLKVFNNIRKLDDFEKKLFTHPDRIMGEVFDYSPKALKEIVDMMNTEEREQMQSLISARLVASAKDAGDLTTNQNPLRLFEKPSQREKIDILLSPEKAELVKNTLLDEAAIRKGNRKYAEGSSSSSLLKALSERDDLITEGAGDVVVGAATRSPGRVARGLNMFRKFFAGDVDPAVERIAVRLLLDPTEVPKGGPAIAKRIEQMQGSEEFTSDAIDEIAKALSRVVSKEASD